MSTSLFYDKQLMPRRAAFFNPRGEKYGLDTRLDEMSGPHNAELWTDALRSRPEWEEARRQAREILDVFGWSIEEQDA